MLQAAERGVRIPAFGGGSAGDPGGKTHIAQAEFYYDDGGDWGSQKDNAMWNMFWRARLRRNHVPTIAVPGLDLGLVSGGDLIH